jgi:3',5'-cyclic AMP phosphodiesterase CpdA
VAKQELTQAMIRRVSPRAEFGILPGDIIYPDGESAAYDAQLMTPWRNLLANTPVWPALGNHDWHVDPDSNFCKEWALPNNEHYYSFDFGNAHFIALDTADGFLYDEANQLAWLEADLAKPRPGCVWTFVYYHHPLLTCTYKKNLPKISAKLWPIFDRYRVDVVFNGHAHTYERLYPLVNGVPVDQAQDPHYRDPQGTMYIVSGCGGKTNEDPDEATTFCGPTAAFSDRRILFTQVFVYGHWLYIPTFDSMTGEIVDYTLIEKTPTTSDAGTPPAIRRLRQNVPNPFNPSTTIPFDLATPTRVSLRVYRADGGWVADIADRIFAAGPHRVTWDGRDGRGQSVSSGVYLLRMQAEGAAETIKMMLVR